MKLLNKEILNLVFGGGSGYRGNDRSQPSESQGPTGERGAGTSGKGQPPGPA